MSEQSNEGFVPVRIVFAGMAYSKDQHKLFARWVREDDHTVSGFFAEKTASRTRAGMISEVEAKPDLAQVKFSTAKYIGVMENVPVQWSLDDRTARVEIERERNRRKDKESHPFADIPLSELREQIRKSVGSRKTAMIADVLTYLSF